MYLQIGCCGLLGFLGSFRINNLFVFSAWPRFDSVPGRHILKDLRDFTDFLQPTIQPTISLNRIRKQVKIVAKQEFEELPLGLQPRFMI
jgi:hypothetical protein